MTNPLTIARRWAKAHLPQTDTLICITHTVLVGGVQRHNQLGKQAGYFPAERLWRNYYVASPTGITRTPLIPRHLPAVEIDLRAPNQPPTTYPTGHALFWATLRSGQRQAACPCCGTLTERRLHLTMPVVFCCGECRYL